MTEDEYVLVSDYARVRAARSLLSDLVLTQGTYVRPTRIALDRLEAHLFAQIEIASPEDDLPVP